VDVEQHTVGKAYRQRIESKHRKLRTRTKRVVRLTIRFAKTERVHDLVIGLFINWYEFERAIQHAIHNSKAPDPSMPFNAPHLTGGGNSLQAVVRDMG
jgi:hypothetical protein